MGSVADDVFSGCSIPVVDIDGFISLNGLDTIIQVWKRRNDLVSWKCCYKFDAKEFMGYFNLCEIRHFTYPGPIDRGNPPVFMDCEDHEDQRTTISFYILRPDGRVLCVTIDPFSDEEDGFQSPILEFRLCPIDEGPLALRNL